MLRYLVLSRLLARLLFEIAWALVRAIVFAVLVMLEPIARSVFSLLGLICVLMAFFFEFLTDLSVFPLWGMLGVSLACLWLLVAYYALIRAVGR